MSKLLSLELWNFQHWKHKLVEFDAQITVIVGPNDHGKSTMIRALRWVAFNRPLGDSVIRWGQDGAKVRLVTESCKVERSKGDGVNHYKLNGGKPFDALGTTVPDSVTDKLRLEEVNFQKQIDAPFWLTQTAGEVAREFNRVVDLEVIDASMAYAASKIKSTTTEVKVLAGLVEDAERRATVLAWVSRAEALLRRAQDRAEQARLARQRAEGVSRLTQQIREARTLRRAIPDLSIIDAKVVQLQRVWERLDGVSSLVAKIKAEQEELCRLRTMIGVRREEVRRLQPQICAACGQPMPNDR